MNHQPHLFVLLAMLLLPSVATCQKDNQIQDAEPILLTKAESQVCNVTNDFSLRVFQRLVDTRQNGDDIIFSPFSLTTALAMSAEGANGDTWKQFSSTLGWDQLDHKDIVSYFQKMISGLQKVDPSVHFNCNNSIWVQQGFSINDEYSNKLSDYYSADLFEEDFSSTATISSINKWVSEKTGGIIRQMVQHFTGTEKMLLLNALLFNGPWSFDASRSGKDSFIGTNGIVSKEYFDFSTDVAYTEKEDFQLFLLLYGNGAYGMEVILPSEGKDLGSVLSSLTLNDIQFTENRDADIHFPMFSTTWRSLEKSIPQVLGTMGLTLPFSPEADFSGIHKGLVISDIIQQSGIEVTDKGTVFVAATDVSWGDGAPLPPSKVVLRVDRPFAYFIKETSSNTILMMGTLSQ